MSASNNAPLLIELLTEELPPKALKRLGDAFANSIVERLVKEALCAPGVTTTSYASPRRLAVHIQEVHAQAPNRERQEKLLPVSIALDASGQPTPPLIKKLASLGVTLGDQIQLADLERVHDGKQEQLIYRFTAPGARLQDAAQAALEEAIAKLPIPKVMTYQRANGDTVKFVRPAHRLLALHGAAILPISVLGLTAGNTTQGHRFHCSAPITIGHADQYDQTLKEKGRVIASFAERQSQIAKALQAKAAPDIAIMPEALLEEVTSLVEWPVVLQGQFEAEFLSVPQECLILTMQQNQKYFALTNQHGKLINRFLLVSNIESKDPTVVVSGNERVLRARLSDAKFFFDQDRKKTLASRIDGLASVVYHNKIGNQRQRIDRLARLAKQWAPLLGADPAHAERAAMLAKADLLTDMVGEFPELQGVIGTYYARHDQENEDVAQAIEAHYHPRYSGDSLPANPTGCALALADKLETLVGIWGIGLAPTGDKDPFALRRHALGVIRILIEHKINAPLNQLLADTAACFAGISTVAPDLAAIEAFVHDRLRAWLKEKNYSIELIEAVIAQCPHQLDQILSRLDALKEFLNLPEAASLCSANKRIGNILKKSESSHGAIQVELLTEPAEQALAQTLEKIAPIAAAAVAQGRYAEGLSAMAALKAPVDAFFDTVMVNADDPQLRANRLALLHQLHQAMNQVGDLSRLAA
ncbi:glycine--tRNA ligase subunit beta [beta proteobacterium MWH-UniP1]